MTLPVVSISPSQISFMPTSVPMLTTVPAAPIINTRLYINAGGNDIVPPPAGAVRCTGCTCCRSCSIADIVGKLLSMFTSPSTSLIAIRLFLCLKLSIKSANCASVGRFPVSKNVFKLSLVCIGILIVLNFNNVCKYIVWRPVFMGITPTRGLG